MSVTPADAPPWPRRVRAVVGDSLRSGAQTRWPSIVLGVELALAAGFLLGEATRLWFVADDWSFILHRDLSRHPLQALFAPHNEHWSTIPVLIFRGLFNVFGVKHYLPYAFVLVAAHMGVCLLLWALLRRVGTPPWIAVAAAGVMAFLGAGAENTTWAFQIGFVGSVFFGLAAVLLAERSGPFTIRDAWVWAASIAALMCSGIGLTMLVVLVIFAIYRRGWLTAVIIMSVPVASFLVWYAKYGHVGTTRDAKTPGRDYLKLPRYVWTGVSSALRGTFGLPGSGVIGFILVVAVLLFLLVRGRDRAAHLAVACGAGAFVLYLFTGYARIRLGVHQATASRYAYVSVALLLPALAWCVARIPRRQPYAAVALGLGSILVVLHGVQLTDHYVSRRAPLIRASKEQILAASEIVRSGQRILSQQPDPRLAPDVNIPSLRRPSVQRGFPRPSMSKQAILDAEAFVRVGISPKAFAGIPPALSIEYSGVTVAPETPPGCTTLTPAQKNAYADLEIPQLGGQVRFITTAERLTLMLRRGSLTSTPSTWKVTPGKPAYLASIAQDAGVRLLLLPNTQTAICLAKPSS